MLGSWPPHAEYQQQTAKRLYYYARFQPHELLKYEGAISKLFILDLDPLRTLLAPLYSTTGAPAKNQPAIFRAFVLMNHLKLSPDEWFKQLPNAPVLQIICGFRKTLPGIASYYNFIGRVINLNEKPRVKPIKKKPKEKYGKDKMPPKHPGAVQKLVKRILSGRRLNLRPERLLQEIFAEVCVQRSIELGLVPKVVSVSGDGTCVETGASPFGRRTCGCFQRGIFKCDCPRRFSDPNAAWGWDSHKKCWFYGYMGYFISTYNRADKLDLPLYLRIVDAKRHDSVSAVVALAELRDLYPGLTFDTFISDSASDNYATYQLLDAWNINAVIALNGKNAGNAKYPTSPGLNEHGVPICPGGRGMVCWGYCPGRCRIKWRCPRACGKSEPCDACGCCSPSPYGRVIYTKPKWDLRLFTRIPRGSHHFKLKMKERTASERVNNRILHHYGLEESKVRGKKRISFFAAIAGFNIHLDAQLAKLKSLGQFDFASIFGLSTAA